MSVERMDLDTLSFVSERVQRIHGMVTHLMNELEPDNLTEELTMAINDMGEGVLNAVNALQAQAIKYGFEPPPQS